VYAKHKADAERLEPIAAALAKEADVAWDDAIEAYEELNQLPVTRVRRHNIIKAQQSYVSELMSVIAKLRHEIERFSHMERDFDSEIKKEVEQRCEKCEKEIDDLLSLSVSDLIEAKIEYAVNKALDY
jgi:hypothetical protein